MFLLQDFAPWFLARLLGLMFYLHLYTLDIIDLSSGMLMRPIKYFTFFLFIFQSRKENIHKCILFKKNGMVFTGRHRFIWLPKPMFLTLSTAYFFPGIIVNKPSTHMAPQDGKCSNCQNFHFKFPSARLMGAISVKTYSENINALSVSHTSHAWIPDAWYTRCPPRVGLMQILNIRILLLHFSCYSVTSDPV